MILLFWVCTILLAIAVLGGAWYAPASRYAPAATSVLVVIDLIILGLRLFGAPHY